MSALTMMTVSDGPADSALTNSGVALGLTTALASSDRVELLESVSARPEGLTRAALMAATIRPTRDWWWANFNLGPINIHTRSAIRDRAIRHLTRSHRLDVVVHIRNIYLPSTTPYVAFIDSTSAMANQGWSAWRPKTRRALDQRMRLERAYYHGALRVLTAGPHAAASVISDYQVPPERVEAVGGGVNYSPLPELRSGNRTQTILWVGLDFERKGGDLLVAAFRRVRSTFPDAKLVLVGATAPVSAPGIVQLGVVRDREELAELYREAAVFCLPARHEPYGLVVQEAMAFAVPCVVSDTGALPSIVEDGICGRVVPCLEEEGLAAVLIEVMSNPVRAEAMGAAGRSKVERDLTWDAVAGRLLDAIEIKGAASS